MNISREELKEKLIQIKENDCNVPEGVDAFDMTLEMLKYLGDTDKVLRDDLIYSIFFKWAVGGVYTKEQFKHITAIITDNQHLFHNIGENGTDSVFMRAFSVLFIAISVYLHREKKYFTLEELKAIKAKTLEYMAKEKDVRGYVEEGGWAHSAAHSADAIDELAQCEEFGRAELLEILQTVKEKVCTDYHAYICLEDERLTVAVNSVIGRNILSEAEVAEWVRDFKAYDRKMMLPQRFYLVSNMRNFLNSLYYRLPEGKYDIIKSAISETVLDIRPF